MPSGLQDTAAGPQLDSRWDRSRTGCGGCRDVLTPVSAEGRSQGRSQPRSSPGAADGFSSQGWNTMSSQSRQHLPAALTPCPGGSGSSCTGIQDRKQKPARPKGSAGGIQGDRKQLNSLEFVQVLGAVTPSPAKGPRVAFLPALCPLGEVQGSGTSA